MYRLQELHTNGFASCTCLVSPVNNDIKDEQIPEEIKSMAGLVTKPRSDWCDLEVDLSGCPKLDYFLSTDCWEPLQVAGFQYTGNKCNNKTSRGRFCEDFEEGPSSKVGDKAYILAVSDGGSYRHYAGYVEVGQEFILNESKELDMLPSDLVIYIYREKNEGLLQTITSDLSCKDKFYLFTPFGAMDIHWWVERSGRNLDDSFLFDETSITWELKFDAKTSSNSNVTLTSANFLASPLDEPISLLPDAEVVLRPGAPMRRLRGIPITTRNPDFFSRREPFFITVVGEDAAGNECNDSSFLMCSIL